MTYESGNLKTIRRVRALLADREAWTKGTLARDANWAPVQSLSPEAVCWCLVGASERADPQSMGTYADEEIETTLRALGKTSCIQDFNDSEYTEHEDILMVLDHTIERLEYEIAQCSRS
jgi:hypothetical protein